jgi:hypothetical protein
LLTDRKLTSRLEASLEINHHMSASNDKLLFDAAMIGNLKEVKDLLFKGARTGFINEVN